MSLRNIITENVILPVSDWLTGQHVYRDLRFLSKTMSWTEVQTKAYQEKRLRELISHAAKHVPYYQDWFSEMHLKPEDICSIEDLRRLPVVDKALMRKEGIERFTANNISPKQRRSSRSSGSTGEPFSFYVSSNATSLNTAAKLLTWYQASYRLGDRYMKIANGTRHGRLKTLQDRVNNCLYVPFYSIGDDTLKGILDLIENCKPLFIRSYPIPLHLLAQYRMQHPPYHHHPKRIFTTGSTLPQTFRTDIEQAFGCDVIDSYSCEGVANTYETLSHDGYHISNPYGIIEVLDNDGKPVINGIGRVVGTDLWNMAHPFIRYDSQDLVEVCNGQITRIMGRECESLIDVSGKRYTVHNFVGFFQEDDRPTKQSIDAYQVVCHKDNSITFRLLVNEEYDDTIEEYILNYWSDLLGIPINIEKVSQIPLMKNNKRLTIIKE